MTAGCLPFPTPGNFDHAVTKFSAVDDDSLHAVVVREAGTTTTWWGACPKTYHYPNESWVYLVSYKLESEPPGKASSPRVRLLRHTSGKGLEEAGRGWAYPRLAESRPVSLHSDRRTGLKRLEDGPDPNDREKLESLGFDSANARFLLEGDGARWYLGFDSFEPHIQVCSPTTDFFAETRRDSNYGAIWDYERGRVVYVDDWPQSDIVGLPSSVTVWDYREGKTTSYRLAEISPRELRHARPGKLPF